MELDLNEAPCCSIGRMSLRYAHRLSSYLKVSKDHFTLLQLFWSLFRLPLLLLLVILQQFRLSLMLVA